MHLMVSHVFGLLMCSQALEMHAGAGMLEAIPVFGHLETFTSSHQHDNCRLAANTFLTLLIVQDAAECVCVDAWWSQGSFA